MTQLRVGVLGGGLVAQVEHVPNLVALPELFRVVGVADPSQKVRSHLAARYGIAAFETAEALLAEPLDAVVVATPDAYHADLVVAAIERGLHVFCEKPLCYAVADAERIRAARDRAGRIVQVGYMKRFDPAYRALRDLLQAHGGPVRAVNVDVVDSDAWAYVAHRDLVQPDDVAPALIAESGARRADQVNAALGFAPEPAGFKGFSGPYCSSIIHDLNLVQGLLAAIDTAIDEPIGAAFIDGDAGGFLSARLTPGDAVVAMTWVAAPKVAYYSERISLVFEDAVYELRFPSPYLNHQPTALVERRSDWSSPAGDAPPAVIRRALRRGTEGLACGHRRWRRRGQHGRAGNDRPRPARRICTPRDRPLILARMKGFPDLPPVWFVACGAVSWLLARLVPVAVLDLPRWLGWSIVAVGFIWAGSAAALFLIRRTPVEPRHTPKVLLVGYHFRVNRNPIYSGLALMLLGWAIVLGALTAYLPVVVFPVIITSRFVVDEERRLRAAFGQAADDFFARTRRW